LILETLESWKVYGCNQNFDEETTNAAARQILSAEDSPDVPGYFIKSYSYYMLKTDSNPTCK
jgi:hypothetical protein